MDYTNINRRTFLAGSGFGLDKQRLLDFLMLTVEEYLHQVIFCPKHVPKGSFSLHVWWTIPFGDL